MDIHGIQNVKGSGAAQIATRQAEESQRATAGTEELQTAQSAQTDKYDHGGAIGTKAKGVYSVKGSHSGERAEKHIAGPDDYREVEALKRKEQRLLQRLSGESDEGIRAELENEIQQVAAQISMKESLAAKQ